MIPHAHMAPRQRVFRATLQDGAIELLAGLALVMIGVAWLVELIPLGAIAPALVLPLWRPLRSRLIEPRLGHVRYDTTKLDELRRGHGGMLLLGCLTLAIALAFYFGRDLLVRGGTEESPLVAGLPIALLGVAALSSAWMFRLPRVAVYALPFFGLGLLVGGLGLEPGLGLLACGVVLLAAGGWLLWRFLRAFPVLSNELD